MCLRYPSASILIYITLRTVNAIGEISQATLAPDLRLKLHRIYILPLLADYSSEITPKPIRAMDLMPKSGQFDTRCELHFHSADALVANDTEEVSTGLVCAKENAKKQYLRNCSLSHVLNLWLEFATTSSRHIFPSLALTLFVTDTTQPNVTFRNNETLSKFCRIVGKHV